MNIYEKALKQSKFYIKKNILKYNSLRNFDFGANQRDNVSCLSSFFCHRVLLEYNMINEILKIHSYSKVEKYIQEIFWRIYWKGWLEIRPEVWDNFLLDLNEIKYDKFAYEDAINARTNISCFNDWVLEIKRESYLHNHTRMWFASIWIFTLNLPWQLGAKFFLKYLKDGDAASNTLSWKWVAGLQTKGKHYLANSQNIAKYTNNRYTEIKLNQTAVSKNEIFIPSIRKLPEFQNKKLYSNIIIMDTDLFIHDRLDLLNKYNNVYIVFLKNDDRKIKLSNNVINFKKELLKDIIYYLPNSKLIDSTNLKNAVSNLEGIDIIYPNIGENLDFISKKCVEFKLKTNFLYRELDLFSWQFCEKGFFKFKQKIPNIIKHIKSLNF